MGGSSAEYCFKYEYHKKQMENIITAVINILLNIPPIYTINPPIITDVHYIKSR